MELSGKRAKLGYGWIGYEPEVEELLQGKTFARIGIPLFLCMMCFGVQTWTKSAQQKDSQPEVLLADSGDLKAQFALAQKTNSVVVPPILYHKAWRLIKDSFYEQSFNKQDWSRWEHHYDGKLKTLDDAHKAIESMLYSLGDPYTRFLDREAFEDEKSQIEAHLFGVGMQLGMNKEHKVVVIAPIEGTPAGDAKVQPGDEIVDVDAKPVKGQSLDTVVKQIRGPKGTKVEIKFQRHTDFRTVDLTRAEIPIKAVASAQTLPGNIGYIRLDSFISSKANTEMRNALSQLKGTDGLILDLRNNPGGLLTNAIEIANMFLDKGIIVSTVDPDGYKSPQWSNNSALTKKPLVVLINGGSASASEILSGALRDNGRAKLVGQKSFGKGLVQAINRLEDQSGINITIAKYLTPNDTDINKTGIVPDYEVKLKEDDYNKGLGPWWIDLSYQNFKRSPTDSKDIQLNKAIEVLKQEISAPASKTAQATPQPTAPVSTSSGSN